MSSSGVLGPEAVAHAADVLLASGHFLSALELYRETGTRDLVSGSATKTSPTQIAQSSERTSAATATAAAAGGGGLEPSSSDCSPSMVEVPEALCVLFDAYPPSSDRLRAAQESARARLRSRVQVRQQSAEASDRTAALRYELRTAREDAATLSQRLRETESQLESARQRLLSMQPSASAATHTAKSSNSSSSSPSEPSLSEDGASTSADTSSSTMVVSASLLRQPESAEVRAQKEAFLGPPAQPLERAALQYMVYAYLLQQGYSMSAVTLCEESGQSSLDDWEAVSAGVAGVQDASAAGSSASSSAGTRSSLPPPALLSFYRYFYGAGPNLQLSNLERTLHEERSDAAQLQAQLQATQQAVERAFEATRAEQDTSKKLRLQLMQSQEQLNQLRAQLSHPPAANATGAVPTPTATTTTAADAPKAKLEQSVDADTLDSSQREDTDAVAAAKAGEISTDAHSTAKMYHLHPLYSSGTSTGGRLGEAIRRAVSSKWDSNNVVEIVAVCLPHIVEGVILKKREELLPVLLSVIRQHPDSQARDTLTKLLFNLILRPTADQRRMIMDGCVALAQLAGPERTEIELLPQCWEQITDRYEERRILVAQSCGALAPFVRPALVSSLVLSILQQLLDDKSAAVRETVAIHLSSLVSLIRDEDKFEKVLEMLVRLLDDTDSRVVASTQTTLLLIVADWASSIGAFTSKMLSTFLATVLKIIHTANGDQSLSRSQVRRLLLTMDAFSLLLPRARLNVLLSFLEPDESAPQLVQVPSPSVPLSMITPEAALLESDDGGAEAGATDLTSNRIYRYSNRPAVQNILRQHQLEELVTEWMLAEDVHTRLTARFEEFLSTQMPITSETSHVDLRWFATEFFRALCGALIQADLRDCDIVVRGMAAFVRTVCETMGPVFTRIVVKPIFVAELEKESYMASATEVQLRRDRLLPIYLAGVLSSLDDSSHLLQYLKESIVNSSLEEYAWKLSQLHTIKEAFQLLCEQNPSSGSKIAVKDEILNLLRDLVVHPATEVRASILQLFDRMIELSQVNVVEQVILPSLITLSNDVDSTVRFAAVRPLCTVALNTGDVGILEKLSAQFDLLIETSHGSHVLILEIIENFQRITPEVHPDFRDQHILPKLVRLSQQNNRCTNDLHRGETAHRLLEAYRAFNGCMISAQLIQQFVVPGLHYLLNDADLIDPGQKARISRMVRDMEKAVAVTTPVKKEAGFLEKAGGIFKSQTSSSSPSAFTVKRLSSSSELSTAGGVASAGNESVTAPDSPATTANSNTATTSSWMDRLREKVES
eukprot:CAMPEP_0174231108 /NCGR_PEP_ID=MMETSP0417-20130205/1715_1 /TAXON_ID=242541 /ORGANISM="Mayorella sp, Strain BSH-02190019" /LENGTH=1289 /DNA_ID=CAMNT_0015308929 /DNA_START=1 /DNA_END=3867 /DNA_ORIENTATION=-